MRSKYVVIGLGQFGGAIARVLSQKGAEVLAIDIDQANVEAISDEVAVAVQMDATDRKALMAHNIQSFDGVIVAIGENFEQLIHCVVVLQELGIKRIMARARGKNQKLILERLGIKEILSPEDEVGMIVAERLVNPSMLSYLQLPDDYRIVEIKAPPKMITRTVGECNLRDRYRLSIITIKRETERKVDNKIVLEQHIEGVPSSDAKILTNDTLVLFGTIKDIDRFIEINK